ncbi:hypothetical protein UFOVP1236_26 [uncultured Caudovirales phage]|uniref:Uncharacterized protein n=1 Tax=uncultured Caudovirales phage TaxID=2100421 RepID=A0A6J5RCX4_9CAUD|nr:hypothetical protein UFOVP1236_26 [uncultured Caudovirales phage]
MTDSLDQQWRLIADALRAAAAPGTCETCATGVARDGARQCLACRDREADADAHIDAQQRMAARRAMVDADRELDAADRLLSVATAAGWLQRQGVSAPATTVRYWVKRGHLPSQRTSRGHLVVSVSTLRAFAAQPQF